MGFNPLKTLSLIILGLALIIGSSAMAKQVPRYGVVDMQKVILTVDEGKAARTTLEKEIKAKEKEFLSQKEELDKMNKDWKSQAALLSEDARLNKQREFQEKFLALRNAEMEFQAAIKRKEQQATQKIAIKVAKLVDKIARDQTLEAVFESNSSGLLYLSSPVDLTEDVIKEYAKTPGKTAKK